MKTIQDIKDELPRLRATYQGKSYTAQFQGRALAFPKLVLIVRHERNGRLTPIMGPAFEFTWEAATRLVNAGKVVKL